MPATIENEDLSSNILLFYTGHVSFDQFLKYEADKNVEYAAYFFIKYTAEIE